MTDKLFTIAGTSTVGGVNTLRFATGKVKVREGVLRRAGHTDINLRELPKPMTRAAAAAWLAAQGIQAILPVKGGRGQPLALTPEQIAEAEAVAKKAAWEAEKAAVRAAAKAARAAALDHNFMVELTGGNKVPVPEVEAADIESVAKTEASDIDVDELLSAVAPEGGVDHEREIAKQGT